MANLKLDKFSIKQIARLLVGLLIAVTVFAELVQLQFSLPLIFVFSISVSGTDGRIFSP